MNMGEKIKYHRELLHMTLEELGNKVGVGKSTVRKWENGMIANMRRDKIDKIAKALEISPAYLMGWVDNPAPDYPETTEGRLEQISNAESEFAQSLSEVLKENGMTREDIRKAADLFRQFQRAIPQVQAAVETLLKDSQSDA